MTNRDEFDDPKTQNLLSSVGPKAAFFIVLIALSFMIGVVWKLYVGGGASDGSSENVPIIRADKAPYKVQPESPGGMQMPNKDSTIFSSLNADNDSDRGIENLLADNDEEDPVPRSQLFAGLNTERDKSLHAESQDMPLDKPLVELNEDEARILSQAKEAKAIVSNLLEDGVDAIEATDDEITEKVVTSEDAKINSSEMKALIEKQMNSKEPLETDVKTRVESETPAAIEKKAQVKKVESQPTKVEPKKLENQKPAPKLDPTAQLSFNQPVTLGGDYYIQLASVQDRTRTESEWSALKRKYGSILSGYKYRVETASLAKGTYYRIQAGPVSKAQANKTCNAIKVKSPSGCIVKKK